MLRYIKNCLSSVIDISYRLRRLLYSKGLFSSYSLPSPVISIGNIELGGTGKTPFTSWVVDYYENKNLQGSVLTRGYKRRKSVGESVQVTPSNIKMVDMDTVGDEPMLLATKMKRSMVIVGPNRLDNYYSRAILKKDDFIVLEDGHQHLKILRSLNIVLVNANTLTEELRCFPSGFLREGVSALLDADILIFSKCDDGNKANRVLLNSYLDNFLRATTIRSSIKFIPKYLKNLKSGEVIPIDRIIGKEFAVFSGIAKVEPFHKDLMSIGIAISDKIVFGNHHSYNKTSYQRINKLKSLNGLVCTEKDAVKLDLTKITGDVFSLVNTVEFIEGESKIKEALDKVLNC